MKKKILHSLAVVLVLVFSCAIPLAAQKFELNPFIGYQTSARAKTIEGTFNISDGLIYGGAINIRLKKGYRIELSYGRMVSDLTYTLDENTDPVSDLAVNSISLGGILEFNPGDMAVAYTGFALGTTIYQPVESDLHNERVMHFALSGGVKLSVTDYIGFRFNARLLLPLFFEGFYFTEGLPDDGQGISTKLTGVQGDFTAGIIFSF
jgi:hypothetical protein